MKRAIIITLLLCMPLHASNEIRAFTAATTAWACVRNQDGQVWYISGQTFEAWGTSGRTATDYDITMTDRSGDMFTGDMDTNISAGYYYLVTHQQAGASPADTDAAVYHEYGYWTGTTWTAGARTSAEVADAVWDEATADHTTETSFGGELGTLDPNITAIKAIVDVFVEDTATLAAVASPNEVTLGAGAVDTNDAYNGMMLTIMDATDSHYETRYIVDYNSSNVTFVDTDYSFTPVTADTYWVWNISFFPLDAFDAMDRFPYTIHIYDTTNQTLLPGIGSIYRREE